jgi:hypothetical protein
VIAPVTY